MFSFTTEPEIPMLTVTRTGEWSLATVAAHEIVFRQELYQLQLSGKPRGLIVDIGATWPQERNVAWALRRMEARLGDLRPERIAVVSSFGASRLHARHLKEPDTQIFASMKYAREWILRMADPTGLSTEVHEQPCQADPEGMAVHVYGPSSDMDVMLTPSAALETAKRIGNAAVEVIIGQAMADGERASIATLGHCADASLANCRLQAQTSGGQEHHY
ncbi:hypothetical protein [Blastomonas aquatica]|uniref:Uncharacterized protein n=1 Tax=Blastomonas aquatica TaxID=1510276 RepID=A0ABQ1J400_9SPHN|nr:hypothetical protein [Blastomonas aquatica]GGB58093.1 hypothetical protein GCM10010833_11080 [Blastomonas aquatica]